jgi:hypothetical protein
LKYQNMVLKLQDRERQFGMHPIDATLKFK